MRRHQPISPAEANRNHHRHTYCHARNPEDNETAICGSTDEGAASLDHADVNCPTCRNLMPQAMQLTIGSKTRPVSSFSEASELWCAVRDASGLGASESPIPTLMVGNKALRISYNGRIWDGETMVFDSWVRQ